MITSPPTSSSGGDRHIDSSSALSSYSCGDFDLNPVIYKNLEQLHMATLEQLCMKGLGQGMRVDISGSNKRLKTAWDSHKREQEPDYEALIKEIDDEERALFERSKRLEEKKIGVEKADGNGDASPGDLMTINAGGVVIAVKRETLCQLKGTRMEALFSGRWDKKLQRDSNGRIFLDVNPVCFQAIINYLNEMMKSSGDQQPPPALPTVDVEHKHILKHQFELFGIEKKLSIDSDIIKDETHVTQLHNWLKEIGPHSDGEFELLYRSSRDGAIAERFHSKCNERKCKCTMTVIETTDGHVVGAYSDMPWKEERYYLVLPKNKIFMFCLSGESDPFKIKKERYLNYYIRGWGPVIGSLSIDLRGETKIYQLRRENNPLWPLDHEPACAGSCLPTNHYTLKEMEVFEVKPTTAKKHANAMQVQLEKFSKEVIASINDKWDTLLFAKEGMTIEEESFKDEEKFISSFATGQPQDVVTLNVCGRTMMTRLQTLQLCEESALASKFFSVGDQEEQVSGQRIINDWSHEEVAACLKKVDGIPNEVVKEFVVNQVTGRELLAVGVDGWKDLGVTRNGAIYRRNEIKKLDKASSDSAVTLIKNSPYIFEKILDHLRLEHSFTGGIVSTKHELPTVREVVTRKF